MMMFFGVIWRSFWGINMQANIWGCVYYMVIDQMIARNIIASFCIFS